VGVGTTLLTLLPGHPLRLACSGAGLQRQLVEWAAWCRRLPLGAAVPGAALQWRASSAGPSPAALCLPYRAFLRWRCCCWKAAFAELPPRARREALLEGFGLCSVCAGSGPACSPGGGEHGRCSCFCSAGMSSRSLTWLESRSELLTLAPAMARIAVLVFSVSLWRLRCGPVLGKRAIAAPTAGLFSGRRWRPHPRAPIKGFETCCPPLRAMTVSSNGIPAPPTSAANGVACGGDQPPAIGARTESSKISI